MMQDLAPCACVIGANNRGASKPAVIQAADAATAIAVLAAACYSVLITVSQWIISRHYSTRILKWGCISTIKHIHP